MNDYGVRALLFFNSRSYELLIRAHDSPSQISERSFPIIAFKS